MIHISRAQDIPLAGAWTGEEPGWNERRVQTWLGLFIALGIGLRLVRFGLNYPIWMDEAYLAANLLDRDFWGLPRPLDYQQVCPLLFLWVEKAISLIFGFNELSLRLVPTISSVASLFLFRHFVGRLLKGSAVVIAVAILAVAYTPIRHGGEIKPYATDFLVALGLLTLAVEWVRTPGHNGFLWALAALGPIAVAISNPAIFVAASCGFVLAIPIFQSRSLGAIVPFGLFGVATVTMFFLLLQVVNASQSANVMEWMRVYWANAFPPRSLLPLLAWLVRVHTSQMFAYPAGGDIGASSLTTSLVLVAIIAYMRRGSKIILALLLMPFVLGLIAAFLGRYPYGGSARTMQYVAPAIIVMAGLGAAVLIARLPQPRWRERVSLVTMVALLMIGLGMLAWDLTYPYKAASDQASREFAQRFWSEEAQNAELVCARTDLHLVLNPFVWQGERAAVYLCNQAIYSDRHRRHGVAMLERVSDTHPLRIVVFGEAPGDIAVMAAWMKENSGRYSFMSKRERVLNQGILHGKVSMEERYVIYEFVPGRVLTIH